MNFYLRCFALQFFLFLFFASYAQIIPGAEVPYRSAENPYYWKFNLPRPGYWQQDVHYEIKAHLDDSTDIIYGDSYKLTYWNNSPDTLKEMYFHLFQNAFTKGSYYDNLNKNNGVKVTFGKYEKAGLGTTFEKLRVNGDSVQFKLDNTILQVILNAPLKPGDSVVVTMKFKTYFDNGSMRRRMKFYQSFGNKHYNGVLWYPAVTVYDQRFGWTTDQHLDKEFYNDFGQFDIWLTLPQQYIVDATGYLMNEDEVLPPALKEQLKLSNFFERKPGDPVTTPVPVVSGATKTWYFRAINVHSFAFTADPDYRMETLNWKGIKIRALVEEPNAPAWKGSAEYTKKVIQVYAQDFGMYIWPKIVVADAKDGMEYPMLTLDNGGYPGSQGVLAHEVGHMWFYGMLGSNETYRALMDEGFTQFLTVWSMDKLLGERRLRIAKSNWVTRFLEPSVTREERLYYPYIYNVLTGYDEPLNTHSSAFNGAIRQGGGYGLVYFKTGTMLYNLRYVLGDSLFLKAMQYYVSKWKMKHPYPADFRAAIIEYTGVDLNWFFDEWLETTKYIDYKIDKVRRVKDNTYNITFKRKGRMQMPIDFSVTTRAGDTLNYLIPNTWFAKKTTATVLPKWYGWYLLNPTYTTRLTLPDRIETVEIDSRHYLADIDLRDNKWGDDGIRTLTFDSRVPNYPQWTKQPNFFRPFIWYNSFDGIQFGPHLEGLYTEHMEYSGDFWVNTGILRNAIPDKVPYNRQWIGFNYTYKKYLSTFWRGLSLQHSGYYNAGIYKFDWGFEKVFRKQDLRNPVYSTIGLSIKYLRNELSYKNYLLYPGQWGSFQSFLYRYVNGTVNAYYLKHYKYPVGSGSFRMAVRIPAVLSEYNYSRISLTSVNEFNIKKFQIRSRIFGQIGFGGFPLESQLYLAGGNPEEMIDNPFTRARGIVPSKYVGYDKTINHFQYPGGLNLRGYAGYLAPEEVSINGNKVPYWGYTGRSGASWNLEADFDNYIKWKPRHVLKNLHLDTYIFSDMGFLQSRILGATAFGKFRMDAGIGTVLTLKFGYFKIKPLVIRLDMPFFLNHPPAGQAYFAGRYVFGIKRAF